jgi:hypothetical protein
MYRRSVSALLTPAVGVRALPTAPRSLPKRITGLVMLLIVGLASAAGAGGQGQGQTVTGTLDVVAVDLIGFRGSRTDYFLREENSARVFELKFQRPAPAGLRSGHRVTASGRADGRQLWVETLSTDGSAASGGSNPGDAAALVEKHAVVLIVDMLDASASSRYTASQIATNMYTGARSVDALYRAASLGQLGFAADTDGDGAPDVFGPFAINYSAAASCGYYDWAYAAESAAQAAGIDLSRYQHRVFVLPHWQQLPKCTWAGVANVGCGTFCRAWIAEGESAMVYSHELGHNLNMAHAGTDPENDGIVNLTYGDESDPMGSSRLSHLFAAPHADQMGWYAGHPGSVATVTASGSYSVAALGANPASSNLPQMLKVAKPDTGDLYYVSYREAVGWDDSLSSAYTRGVNIHRYTGSGYNPTTFITSLTDGGSFNDSVNGITVTQIVHGGGTAGLAITVGGGGGTCTVAPSTASLSPVTALVRRGAAVGYTYALRNNDNTACTPTTFSLNYSGTPSGTLSTSTVNLAGDATGSANLQLNTAVADGYYTLTVQAADNDGLDPAHAGLVTATATVGVDSTPPTVPAGLAASVRKTRVDVTWRPSSDALAGVASYTVFRNGVVVAQTANTTWTDPSAPSGTLTYTVAATDTLGNTSAPAAGVNVTISGGKRR